MHQCRNPDEEIRGLEVISFLDYQNFQDFALSKYRLPQKTNESSGKQTKICLFEERKKKEETRERETRSDLPDEMWRGRRWGKWGLTGKLQRLAS